jgi:cellulose synthase/poly-beta-1,6-N-acetylglucosamine synthase-like glycosyltransferase
VLIQIWLILNFVTTIFCLYQVVVAIVGLHKNKKFPQSKTRRRFAAIIAARNEEAVIGNLIESLKLQNYPRELFDVIVVADNCTDRTAEFAKNAGAIVYKRFNKAEIGKGFVLSFVFEKIFDERDIYDAFCIFDADNVVDRNFFGEMDKAIEAGYEVAQGYRDMKNASDTWISGGHALFFWMENRFFNLARSLLGLSATINGTGFMMTSNLIKEIGYHTTTCTEDIEFSMQCALADKRIGWVPDARLYDEQPITLSQSMNQRLRWISGLIQCYRRYTGPLAKKVVDSPDWATIDVLIYLLGFPAMIFGILAGIMCVLFVTFRIFDPVATLLNLAFLAFGGLAGFWFVGFLTLFLEKKFSKGMLKAVAGYPIFNVLWVVTYIVCIFKKNVEWKPIVHIRNVGISEIESKLK